MDEPELDLVQVGKHVAIIGWNSDLSDYLVTTYKATYHGDPFDMYLIPNIDIEELESDPVLMHSSPREKKTKKKKSKSSKSEDKSSKLEPKSSTPELRSERSPPTEKSNKKSNKKLVSKPKYDINSLLEIDSLEKLVDLYYENTDVQNILNNTEYFNQIRQKHHLRMIRDLNGLLKIREGLDATKIKNKLYNGHIVPDFSTGDRIIFRGDNYIIISSSDTKINFQKVDVFGRFENNIIRTGLLTHNSLLANERLWFWYITDMSREPNIPNDIIRRGILLYSNGPQITSLDSIFLKYITIPYDRQQSTRPEVGMLVSVQNIETIPYYSYVYLITDITENVLKLKYIDMPESEANPGPDTIKAVYTKSSNIAGRYIPGHWELGELGRANLIMGSWEAGNKLR
jgi:hypothetical protein